jgi:hypothetical protein
MAIRMFRVVTGEIVMGETTEENGNMVLSSPMLVNFKPHESGQLALNLFPFNPFASSKDETTTIKESHIMFEVQRRLGNRELNENF